MEIRQITDRYFVSPQIELDDLKTLKQEGFTRVICNRPDMEIPADLHAQVMAIAAEDAGLEFVVLPLTHDTMTPEVVAQQRAALETCDGKVLAYCASGTRSTVAWVLSHTDCHSADELLATARQGGYDLEGLRPRIEFIQQNG